MAVKAYVLIVTDPVKTKDVMRQIHGIPEIKESHEVMGPYDIIIEIVANELSQIPTILGERVRRIEGIESTVSLVTFPDAS